MDFDDTPQEAAFRAEVRRWLDANVPRELAASLGNPRPGATPAEIDALFAASRAWQARKAAAGWACLHWPRAYGGSDRTPIERVIWAQEEGIYGALSVAFTVGHGMCGPTLMAWADEDARRRLLPPLAAGREIWCQLFSEPAGGSDLAGLRTRADPANDGSGDWIVNGQKIWTSGAHLSDWGLLIARTDPAVPKHKGLTMFYLALDSPGVEVRPIRQMNGGARFNEVFFTDVRIPDVQRLGAVGQGWDVSLTTLMNERLAISAMATTTTGFDELLAACRTMEIDGRPALDDGRVRARVADFAVRDRGLRYGRMRAMTALSKGEVPGPENSIGKLVSAAMTQEIAMFALDLQAEAGVLWDDSAPQNGLFQDLLMSAPGSRIAGGTDEILRNVIAERVLGLPGDIRLDKNVAFRDIPGPGPAPRAQPLSSPSK